MVDAVLPVENRGDAFDHRHFVADVVHVGELEPDFASCLGAARLERGAPGKGADHVDAPGTEDQADGALEAGAEGQQDDDRGNSPRHPEHGQRGAAAVVLHRAVGFFQQIAAS